MVATRFRMLYEFVVLELGRQILPYGVTGHPTTEWALPQFREGLPGGRPFPFRLVALPGLVRPLRRPGRISR